jgi:16S rRNA (cytosine967-C5)-methyltransferase
MPRPNRPKPGPGRPRPPKPRPAPARPAPEPSAPDAPQVAPAGLLAEVAVEVAERARAAAFGDGRRADRVVAEALRRRRDLAASDARFVAQAVASWFRWRGWVEPAAPGRPEAQLLLAVLMDLPHVHPACRALARLVGRDPSRLTALGDAPSWTARTDGFKRLVGQAPPTVDPWRLFPEWFRDALPLPPGDGPPKARHVALIAALQAPPGQWVRVQGAEPGRVWDELRELGVKPWVHRRLESAARLGADVDVAHLPPVLRGTLAAQDLAAQAVGLACDPEPGERWWDCFAGSGGHAAHLAALMRGKGVVVATDTRPQRLKGLALRLRRGPYTNVTTKAWDGKHVAGKPGSFAGVLVAPPCSSLGTWRRHPDTRWTTPADSAPRHAAEAARALDAASAGVRPGGLLVYAVATLTLDETTAVVRGFLDAHPGFALDPVPHPLTGAPTDGTIALWPHEADTDGMFVARMIRTP